MARKYVYENNESVNEPSSGISNKAAFLLIGGGIGAALALLFAPKSGRELRGDIADATRKGYDKSRETAGQLRENSGVYYEQLKGQAGDAYNRASNRASEVYTQTAERFRNRGAQNQSFDQLVEGDLNNLSTVDDETRIHSTSATNINS